MTITDFGIAVVKGDSHLSKWVIEQRRLDVARGFVMLFKKYIPEGGVVADIGACLGDHTVTYSELVGERGMVHAFEPNPVALECLQHNMRHLANVKVHGHALGDWNTMARYSVNQSDNLGASNLVETKEGGVFILTLDTVADEWHRLDFIKMDAEGFEPLILDGAKETINKLRPVMLIEINRKCLGSYGHTPDSLKKRITDLGYSIQPAEPHYDMNADQVDVLCLPNSAA